MQTPDRLAASDRARSESAPVFILGYPGSQAALIATALTAGNEFWCSGELHLFYSMLGPNERGKARLHDLFEEASSNETFWLPRNRVVYPEFAASIGDGIDHLIRRRSNEKRWIDASSENLWVAADLGISFPSARFIHIVRDGREIVQEALGAQEQDEMARFEAVCQEWVDYVVRARSLTSVLGERYLEIPHGQLGASPASVARRVMSFLNAKRHTPVAKFLMDHADELKAKAGAEWTEAQAAAYARITSDVEKPAVDAAPPGARHVQAVRA